MSPGSAGAPKRRPRRWLDIAMAAAAIAVGLFLILPIFVVIPLSFSGSSFLEFPPRSFSLRWYEEYFASSNWITSTVNSIQIAGFTALFATAVGTCAALAMYKGHMRLRGAVTGLILSPMVLPHIVLAIAIYGIFAQLRLIGSIWGLVSVYTLLAVPIVYLNVSAALQGLDPSLEQAALTLGATRWRAIRHVILPLVRPGIVAGALLATLLAFDEVVIAIFISGTSAITLPKTMWDGIRTEINPTIAAVSSFLVVLYFIVLGAAVIVRRQMQGQTTRRIAGGNG